MYRFHILYIIYVHNWNTIKNYFFSNSIFDTYVLVRVFCLAAPPKNIAFTPARHLFTIASVRHLLSVTRKRCLAEVSDTFGTALRIKSVKNAGIYKNDAWGWRRAAGGYIFIWLHYLYVKLYYVVGNANVTT